MYNCPLPIHILAFAVSPYICVLRFALLVLLLFVYRHPCTKVFALSEAVTLFVLPCWCLLASTWLVQVVRFVPPLVATAAEVSTALSIVDQALSKVTSSV